MFFFIVAAHLVEVMSKRRPDNVYIVQKTHQFAIADVAIMQRNYKNATTKKKIIQC